MLTYMVMILQIRLRILTLRRRDYFQGPHLITQRLKSGEPIVASIREEDVKIEDWGEMQRKGEKKWTCSSWALKLGSKWDHELRNESSL